MRQFSITLLCAGLCLTAAQAGHANELPSNPFINADAEVPERAYSNAREDGDSGDQRRKTDGSYWRGDFRGWSFGKIGEQVIISDVTDFNPLASASGQTVMRFSEIEEDSFNDNKLFQILDVAEDETLRVRYKVATQFPQESNLERPFNTRLRICFGETACSDQSAEDVTVRTWDLLAPGVDTSLSEGDEALELAPFEWGEVDFEITVPEGETRVRVEFTATDGTDSSNDQPEGPRQVYFDDFRVDLDGTAAPDFENGDFTDFSLAEGSSEAEKRDDYFNRKFTGFPDDDQGPLGWYLTDLDEDDYATSAVPMSVMIPDRHYPTQAQAQAQEAFEASQGKRVFRFLRSGDSFGDDNLDQCVDTSEADNQSFNYSVQARANQATETDAIQLNVELFDSVTDCLLHGDNSLEHRRAYTFEQAGEWKKLISPSVDTSGKDWARVSIRVRDTEGRQNSDDSESWLRVYVDSVAAWQLPEPSLSLDNGALTFALDDRAPDTGVEVAYSLDGSDPDSESPTIAPGAPLEVSEEELSGDSLAVKAMTRKNGWASSSVVTASFDDLASDSSASGRSSSSSSLGCTLGDGATDPSLPLLALAALLSLFIRRHQHQG